MAILRHANFKITKASALADACGLTAINMKAKLAGHDPIINHFRRGEVVNVYSR